MSRVPTASGNHVSHLLGSHCDPRSRAGRPTGGCALTRRLCPGSLCVERPCPSEERGHRVPLGLSCGPVLGCPHRVNKSFRFSRRERRELPEGCQDAARDMLK